MLELILAFVFVGFLICNLEDPIAKKKRRLRATRERMRRAP